MSGADSVRTALHTLHQDDIRQMAMAKQGQVKLDKRIRNMILYRVERKTLVQRAIQVPGHSHHQPDWGLGMRQDWLVCW